MSFLHRNAKIGIGLIALSVIVCLLGTIGFTTQESVEGVPTPNVPNSVFFADEPIQSNPLAFASVELIWEKDVDPFWYKSKNFYRSEGESRPYRSGRHKLVTIRGDSFLMENYDDNLTRRIGCDMLFEFNNDQWEGTLFTKGACIMNGANVSSHMILFGNKIHQSYSIK